MNQIVLGRNASEPLSNYPLVGPTGCAGVERVWTAERYLIGDNEIHWVFDDSGNNPIGNISVAEQHTMVRKLHGDLSEFGASSRAPTNEARHTRDERHAITPPAPHTPCRYLCGCRRRHRSLQSGLVPVSHAYPSVPTSLRQLWIASQQLSRSACESFVAHRSLILFGSRRPDSR